MVILLLQMHRNFQSRQPFRVPPLLLPAPKYRAPCLYTWVSPCFRTEICRCQPSLRALPGRSIMNGTGAGHQSGMHPCGQASLQLLCPSNLALFVSSLPPGPIIPAKPLPNTMFKLASFHFEHETGPLLIEALGASESYGPVCAHCEPGSATWKSL